MTRIIPHNLEEQARELGPWFHNLHLPDGTQTCPDHRFGDFPAFKWKEIGQHLPADLTGWRALDIGCNAGFYSFELAKRGARVVGVDINGHYLRQAKWAAEVYGFGTEHVDFHHHHIYEFARFGQSYDFVLFMGVLYHLRYPLLALDVVRTLAPKLMVFQTLTTSDHEAHPHAREDVDFQTRERLDQVGWPKMACVEDTFAMDPTNWWVPNAAGVEALLRTAGFEPGQQIAPETWLCRPTDHRSGYWLPEEFLAATGSWPLR